ncbi:MAG: sigma 54-interacting transcriptional regulator [Tissierellia bacterium]|nr:sigma 54-interacting transcriptional regulator [Tissierellia bacterium]MDD4437127.1 sigma 54-interacting transcriptional regulator [Tissierellia bacterium]
MNKCRIAIISGFKGTNDIIADELINVFGAGFQLDKILYPDELDDNYDDYDLLLCSSYYIMSIVQNRITRRIPIVLAERNFDMKSLTKLLSINSGTIIYVAGSNKKGAEEVIDLLENIGINHLTLLPYYEQFEVEPSDIILSIVPTPLKNITNKRIVYVKFSDLNIYTLMKIFVELKLTSSKLIQILKKYTEYMSVSNHHMAMMNQNLQGILEIVSEGILCIDKNENTIFCNKSFSELLDIDYHELLSKSYKEIEFEQCLLNIIYKKDDVLYEVINYKDKKLLVTKLKFPNSIKGFILNIQKVSHIQAVESNVRKKLMDKGFTAKYSFENIIGESNIIKSTINEAKKIAKSNFAVLIQGDNGTGKEMFAQAIHNGSTRAHKPFVAINSASLPDNLVESELFGYEQGSFTGAVKGGKAGLFELAHNGTIFIDEIGDISLHIQQKLLRVLQEKEIMRIGANKIIPIDVRVISATNKDLFSLVEKGKFRKDLYYRLKVLYINLPNLNSRSEDIPLFTGYFFDNLNSTKYFNNDSINILKKYSWPGNVRELQNLIYFLETLCDTDEITPDDIPEEFKINMDLESSYNIEFENILSNYKESTIEEFHIILKSLYTAYIEKSSMGKTAICRLMNNLGIEISIEQVRHRLSKLSHHGFINVGKTKQGSKITQNGISFLNYIDIKLNKENHNK